METYVEYAVTQPDEQPDMSGRVRYQVLGFVHTDLDEARRALRRYPSRKGAEGRAVRQRTITIKDCDICFVEGDWEEVSDD